MNQGRFGLVLLMLVFSSLLGCGLQSDGPTSKQTSRLMDELRAQTALKAKLQGDVETLRAELAQLKEEADGHRYDLSVLVAENDSLALEVRELRRERDVHAANLAQLRQGIKTLLNQAEACLPMERDTTAAR